MRWVLLAFAGVLSAQALAAIDPTGAAPAAEPGAAQIVEKNVNARGGLEAWRKVQTMVWTGHVESAHGSMPSVPFVLAQKRPNKTRFEINAMGQKTQRVFDGTRGWKVRPKEDGRPDEQPYTPQEVRFARDGQGIDGPLIDHEAKGNAVALEGTEQVEGRNAYRLQVRLASGQIQHIWVDSQSFLEIKSDRTAYNATGMAVGTVAVFYRDYKAFDGLQIPTTIETGVGSGQGSNKMIIDRVLFNVPLEDQAFTRSTTGGRKHAFARTPDPAPRPLPAAPPAGPGTAVAPDAASEPGAGSR